MEQPTSSGERTTCRRDYTLNVNDPFDLLLKIFFHYQRVFSYRIGMEPVELIIDTDPGVDDALAILLALGHAKVKVAAITTSELT
jgi:hypothetical protein